MSRKGNIEPERIQAIFDAWAGRERGMAMAHNHVELFRALVSGWAHDSSHRVLDLACGNGFALALLADMGYRNLFGIDFAENMVDEARRNVPAAAVSRGPMEDLPWTDGFFDRVYSIEALYYAPRPADVLAEVRRVLKPMGTLDIVIEYYRDNPGSHSWAGALGTELQLWSSGEWVDVMRRAGFPSAHAKRIVRSSMRSKDEFEPDAFFPDYDLYVQFKKEGALHLMSYS